MTAWFAIPSARPIAEAKPCFDAWRGLGFRTAVLRDVPSESAMLDVDMSLSTVAYPGWAASINMLAEVILEHDVDCAVIATGGDDVWPDTNFSADRVERELIEHFAGTLGVVQPCGAVPGYVPWSRGVIDGLPVQERIAWAPWLGRDWCRRAYGGNGPFWAEPRHFFADEHLQVYALRLGLYWQRRDVHQAHKTWKHDNGRRPPHLAHTVECWETDKDLFAAAKDREFPLLPA